MASHRRGGNVSGKRLRATARFLAAYGRLPSEFDGETALGLIANIPAIEAESVLLTARGIAIAMGDTKTLAETVLQVTGSDRLAQRIEVQAQMQRGLHG